MSDEMYSTLKQLLARDDATVTTRANLWLDIWRSDLARGGENREAWFNATMYAMFMRYEKFESSPHYQAALAYEVKAREKFDENLYAETYIRAAMLELDFLAAEVQMALFEGVRLKDTADE